MRSTYECVFVLSYCIVSFCRLRAHFNRARLKGPPLFRHLRSAVGLSNLKCGRTAAPSSFCPSVTKRRTENGNYSYGTKRENPTVRQTMARPRVLYWFNYFRSRAACFVFSYVDTRMRDRVVVSAYVLLFFSFYSTIIFEIRAGFLLRWPQSRFTENHPFGCRNVE